MHLIRDQKGRGTLSLPRPCLLATLPDSSRPAAATQWLLLPLTAGRLDLDCIDNFFSLPPSVWNLGVLGVCPTPIAAPVSRMFLGPRQARNSWPRTREVIAALVIGCLPFGPASPRSCVGMGSRPVLPQRVAFLSIRAKPISPRPHAVRRCRGQLPRKPRDQPPFPAPSRHCLGVLGAAPSSLPSKVRRKMVSFLRLACSRPSFSVVIHHTFCSLSRMPGAGLPITGP